MEQIFKDKRVREELDLDSNEHCVFVTVSTGSRPIPEIETEVLIDAQPHRIPQTRFAAGKTGHDTPSFDSLIGTLARQPTFLELIQQTPSKQILLCYGYHPEDS